MPEQKDKEYPLTSPDAQRIVDRDMAYTALKEHRVKLAAMKIDFQVVQKVGGIDGTHPGTVLAAIEREERIVSVLAEHALNMDAVPEGTNYRPVDLTIVNGSKKIEGPK